MLAIYDWIWELKNFKTQIELELDLESEINKPKSDLGQA